MLKSSDRILTSHAGSLPRPDDLIEANARREAGKIDEASFQKELTKGVADVVRRQKEAGIAVPGDGEYGKSMGSKVNYRAWWSYSFTRLGGLKVTTADAWFAARPSGTEDVYKIYAESFKGPEHLAEVQQTARELVNQVIGQGRDLRL